MEMQCRTCGGEPSSYRDACRGAWLCESCSESHHSQWQRPHLVGPAADHGATSSGGQPRGADHPAPPRPGRPPPPTVWGSCMNCGNQARVYCFVCHGWFCSSEGQGSGSCHRHDGTLYFPWCPRDYHRLGAVSSQLQELDRSWKGGSHFALPPLERLRVMAREVDWARSIIGAAIAQAECRPWAVLGRPTAAVAEPSLGLVAEPSPGPVAEPSPGPVPEPSLGPVPEPAQFYPNPPWDEWMPNPPWNDDDDSSTSASYEF